MENKQEKFEVVVIGGGPAGMLAAGRAAELGAKVALVDKNLNPGKKLLMSGGGRCNLTQIGCDDKEFVRRLGPEGKFLFSALAAFGPREVIEFFEKRGLKTKTEKSGRVFPVTDKAQDALDVLLKYLKENKVRMMFGAEVLKLNKVDNKIESLEVKEASMKRTIYADNFILCTGGQSYPATGSTGDGYRWAKSLGHNVVTPSPALVPVKIKDVWIKDLQGVSLENVQLNIFQNNKKKSLGMGSLLFTHFGLSGPLALNASRQISEAIKQGAVILAVDFYPEISALDLDKKLQYDFQKNSNKDFKNYLAEILSPKLALTLTSLSKIEAKKKLNFITKEDRISLAKLLKNLPMTAEGLMGYNQAMVTSGGVDLREADSKTMRSRIVSNLFFAGEVLNLDGPTGGYNLQICWSTGYAAGTHAALKEKDLLL